MLYSVDLTPSGMSKATFAQFGTDERLFVVYNGTGPASGIAGYFHCADLSRLNSAAPQRAASIAYGDGGRWHEIEGGVSVRDAVRAIRAAAKRKTRRDTAPLWRAQAVRTDGQPSAGPRYFFPTQSAARTMTGRLPGLTWSLTEVPASNPGA